TYPQFDLTDYNSYRINASCRTAYFPECEADILHLYEKKIPYILLGSGHNIIFSKDYYDQDFIIFNGNYNKATITDSGLVEAECGITMLEISELALEHG